MEQERKLFKSEVEISNETLWKQGEKRKVAKVEKPTRIIL